MTGVAVVGCGYWGPNVARNLSAIESCTLRALCDLDPANLAKLKRLYPAVRTTTDFREILDAADIDAVAICTPVDSHYPLARAAIEAGKHVLVEKPLTDSTETARELAELADANGRVLQVDHVFVYSGAVRKIREIIDSGELGELLYIDCVRINLGLFQSDVNVVWDLAAHDVSIVNYLIGRSPSWVSAIGAAPYGRHESQAYVTMQYEGSLLAHLHVNWLAPVKLRSTLIGGSKRMVVYDDLEPSEKIRIYDRGVTPIDADNRERALVDYRVGDMFAPYIEKSEPLQLMCLDFLHSIETGERSQADGRAGVEVVRVLEAAERSIRAGGERVPLEPAH